MSNINDTYEIILERMLRTIPNDVDKREGSIIYDALAPAAAELAQVYTQLQLLEDRTYADTAVNDDLTRRSSERGIVRKDATKAMRKGEFNVDVTVGSRFSGDDLNYIVIDKIATGQYRLECESAGIGGNSYAGDLIPVDYIAGLESAVLTDILIPGEDQESDDSLRKRYFDSLESEAFGGNITDYKNKTRNLQGIGGVKVYPVWNGGGTVKLIIIDSSFHKPSDDLINKTQTAIDPVPNKGEGMGIAPIGHVVTVIGVDETNVDIDTIVTLESGYTWDDIKSTVEATVKDYFIELNKTWDSIENIVVRIAHIESRILGIPGVLDIQNTKLNKGDANLIIDTNNIPKLGVISNA